MVISHLFGLFEQVVDHLLSLAPWLLFMFYFYVGYTGPWALTLMMIGHLSLMTHLFYQLCSLW